MAFSGLYGLTRNCAHTLGKPASRVGVSLAASLDIIATVAIAILIAFGAKMGVHIPSMGQYMLGFAGVINMMMLLHKNIIPVTENFRPVVATGETQKAAPTYVTNIVTGQPMGPTRRVKRDVHTKSQPFSGDSSDGRGSVTVRQAWPRFKEAAMPGQVGSESA